jgi:hypothetical protein
LSNTLDVARRAAQQAFRWHRPRPRM